jgi:putative transposase
LRVTRAGFYGWRRRPESAHTQTDRRLRVVVRAAFERSRRRYGSPRIHRDLHDEDVRVSRKRVVRLMREEGLQARPRKRFKATTDSNHSEPVAPNVLAREFTAAAPNQRWVGDTTELLIGPGGAKLYLAVLLDLFSRFIVGWALSAVNDRHLVLKALRMAIQRRCPDAGLLHHSDRGSPYASEDYQRVLDAHGITCSMSRRGDCYDNAAMESLFSTVKTELGEHFDSYSEAKRQVFDYIELFYNPQRRHSTLDYVSPAMYERGYAAGCKISTASRGAARRQLDPGDLSSDDCRLAAVTPSDDQKALTTEALTA